MFFFAAEEHREQLANAIWFRLSDSNEGGGVSCSGDDVFVGTVPLLVRKDDESGEVIWTARPLSELNNDLGAAYGFPVDMTVKANGIALTAKALNEGNIALAQIAAVHLHLPPLPAFGKSDGRSDEAIALAALLHRSGVLKMTLELHESLGAIAKRDVSNEPRIPRGQPGARQWTTGAPGSDASPVTPAQAIPFEGPIPIPLRPLIRPRPLLPPAPPAVGNPPLDIPDGAPRDGIPQNPFPDRPECVEEWEAAKKFCIDMRDKKRLGRNSGFGSNIWQCMMGQVSEECGGNSSRA